MVFNPKLTVNTFSSVPHPTLEEFLLSKIKVQFFQIDPNRRSTIIGENGTRLTIMPFSFVKQGQYVKEEVSIQLIECYEIKELLLADRTTSSMDRPLGCIAQLYIQAFCNGVALELEEPIRVQAPVSKKFINKTLGVGLYQGSYARTRAINDKRSFDWKLIQEYLAVQKLARKKYIAFNVHQLTWFACNTTFVSRKQTTMLTVKYTCSAVDTFDDLQAFVVIRRANAIAKMHHKNGQFTGFNLPAGLPAYIWILGLHNGQLYQAHQMIGKLDNKILTLNMDKIGEEQVFRRR